MNTSSNRKLHQLTANASSIATLKKQALVAARKKKADSTDPDVEELVSLDPAVVLNYRPQEYRHITEIHLAGKGMQQIHPNTQSFNNLEILWVNDNKLERIDNILPKHESHDVTVPPRGCLRLKRLYASNNCINTLNGDIQRLKYLEVLLLANNRLSNMEGVSAQLAHLRFLKQLDLYGNPLSEEQSYRLYFIHEHPSVVLFDRLTVSDNEREEAKKHFDAMLAQRNNVKLGFGTHIEKPAKDVAKAGPISPSVALVENSVKQIKIRQKAQQEYEETKEETMYQSRAERRRLFHSLWGNKEPGQVRGPNGERVGMSSLFDLDKKGSDVAALIDLAAELEQCEEPKRREALSKEIQKRKRILFPERFGDKFTTVLIEQQRTVADDLKKEYLDKVQAAVFSEEEVKTFTRLFEKDRLSASDIVGMANLLEGGEELDKRSFEAHVRAELPKADSSTDLRGAIVILLNHLPFINLRYDQVRRKSQQEVMKRGAQATAAAGTGAATGSAQSLMSSLQRMNQIMEHAKNLEAHIAADPIAAIKESQRRLGSGVVQVMQQQKQRALPPIKKRSAQSL